eukprot:CAMPEP_0177669536 /NCGR_PEP_ID=MMETSP0447-20121125/23510_1 /TAXON_ID=0 /ORGANISM="Stygamoeba regulata, Strain BSH-02190019" /LENGTH=424 /DNA_ID=CAMNT_0019176443 /DNA_START=171 /DNA_END=1445 /DNA_ORIENTATION=-
MRPTCFLPLLAVCLVVVSARPVPGPVYSVPLHKAHAAHPIRPLAGVDKDPRVFGDVFPVAIFWVYLDVGTPPVSFPVAIDSGSYTLDIPSANCDGCVTKSPNAMYDKSKSSTSTSISCDEGSCDKCHDGQCGFSNTYETCDLNDPTAPCTISGSYYTDAVSFAGLGPVNITFGAIEYQTKNFDQFKNIDGVMGMGGPSGSTNVFQTLVDHGFVQHAIWSLCLHQGSTSNGTFSIGGADPRLYTGDIQWSRNTRDGDMYSMRLQSIAFVDGSDKHVVSGAGDDAILDSGTNVLLLPTEAFDSVHAIFKSMCNDKALHGVCDVDQGTSLFDGKCLPFTDAQLSQFPPLRIEVEGAESGTVTLEMSPSDYLIVEAEGTNLCLGIRPTGQGGILIIGDTTMQNYLTVFDNDSHRIGWAAVNTDNCGSL